MHDFVDRDRVRSAVLYVPERELLLTGDNWNPCGKLMKSRHLQKNRPAAVPYPDQIQPGRPRLFLIVGLDIKPSRDPLCPDHIHESLRIRIPERLQDFLQFRR